MTDRRYTDAEIADIFERASRSELTSSPAVPSSSGLTLTALQDIGREVGLSPEAISLAVRSLDSAGRISTETLIGLPVGVGASAEFDHPITESEWERLVGQLRDTFNAKGRLRQDGTFREWTNGNLHAMVEPTPQGFRLRLRTFRRNSRALMIGGMSSLGVSVAIAIAAGLHSNATLIGAGFMAILGVVTFTQGAVPLPSWARRRREQFAQLLAFVEEFDNAALTEHSPSAPRLNPPE